MKILRKIGILKEFLTRPTTIWILLLALSVILVVGCSAQGSTPPSGPIGGGCG